MYMLLLSFRSSLKVLDSVFLQLPMQRAPADTDSLRRFRAVAVRLLQRLDDQLPFRVPDSHARAHDIDLRQVRATADRHRYIADRQALGAGQHDHLLDGVAQL